MVVESETVAQKLVFASSFLPPMPRNFCSFSPGNSKRSNLSELREKRATGYERLVPMLKKEEKEAAVPKNF